eukprot:6047251-Prymnesium_polylepis.1
MRLSFLLSELSFLVSTFSQLISRLRVPAVLRVDMCPDLWLPDVDARLPDVHARLSDDDERHGDHRADAELVGRHIRLDFGVQREHGDDLRAPFALRVEEEKGLHARHRVEAVLAVNHTLPLQGDGELHPLVHSARPGHVGDKVITVELHNPQCIPNVGSASQKVNQGSSVAGDHQRGVVRYLACKHYGHLLGGVAEQLPHCALEFTLHARREDYQQWTTATVPSSRCHTKCELGDLPRCASAADAAMVCAAG